MTVNKTSDTTDEGSTDKDSAYGSPRLRIEQGPFAFIVHGDEDVPRAEVGVECWSATHHSEARIYLHTAGELPDGGEFSSGVAMSYLQARRVRDLLDDALAEFEE
jgi:hypothetical protein